MKRLRMRLMKNKQLTGATFITISAFFYASYGVWSKLMVGVFGEFNQAWTRALIILAVLVPFGIFSKQYKKIQKKDRVWFLIIALAGGLNQAPYFFGFHYLDIGTATLLFYTALTIGAYIIGKVFFNDKITPIKYLALLLAIVGMGLLYSFSLDASQILPALSITVAGFMGASAVVFSKKISSSYSETQILTSYFTVMLCANFILSFIFKESPLELRLSTAWIAQFGYAASMVFSNLAVVAGFKYLKPSIGSLIGLTEILFAILLGILLFGEVLQFSTIIGGVFILTSALLPIFKKE